MPKSPTKAVMLVSNTPLEDHRSKFGLWVKREDLSCPPPGPPFSKARGVYAHIKSRPELIIGALDTYHSQAGHAVAMACKVLGKKCLNFYPEFKNEPGPRSPQLKAQSLGAELRPLQAGRSAVLYYQAKRKTEEAGGYMMPNALKLVESVIETAKEVPFKLFDRVIIPISSGTIAAGVVKGFLSRGLSPEFIIHMGYSRSIEEVTRYIKAKSGYPDVEFTIVDEGYAYRDKAKNGPDPDWPCNIYYDLKAFRWWMNYRNNFEGNNLFWNIG